jgi:arylsulfatase A
MRLLSLLLTLSMLPLGAAPAKTNVVLILIDDFGYECVTANGGESYRTPEMDKLAASGGRLEQVYAQPLCTPTRVALMTGQGNKRNYTRFGHLDPQQQTFGNIFKASGYATCVAGKWQLSNEDEKFSLSVSVGQGSPSDAQLGLGVEFTPQRIPGAATGE